MFLIQVLELKNTLASLETPFFKLLSILQYKRFREHSDNFPIVLVGATVNRLEIFIAVCVGSIYVSKLLAHGSDNFIRLARIFKALSLYQVDLQEYYDEVNDLTSSNSLVSFPAQDLSILPNVA